MRNGGCSVGGPGGRAEAVPLKKSHGELPRVKYVLGFLRSLSFETLLDRQRPRRVPLAVRERLPPCDDNQRGPPCRTGWNFSKTVALGGASNLRAVQADICRLGGADATYDVVTLLEVLEISPTWLRPSGTPSGWRAQARRRLRARGRR